MSLNDYYIGIDIGGTKCALIAGTEQMEILHRVQFATHTNHGPDYAITKILESIKEIQKKSKIET